MIEIYKAPTPQDAYILLALLETEGINAVVDNDMLFNTAGGLPSCSETIATVFITDDSQKQKAINIVDTYITELNNKRDTKEWICKECGESSPDSFEVCWNCQKER